MPRRVQKSGLGSRFLVKRFREEEYVRNRTAGNDLVRRRDEQSEAGIVFVVRNERRATETRQWGLERRHFRVLLVKDSEHGEERAGRRGGRGAIL
jgi:hypothetical protein